MSEENTAREQFSRSVGQRVYETMIQQDNQGKDLVQFLDNQYRDLKELKGEGYLPWQKALDIIYPELDAFRSAGIYPIVHRPFLHAYDPAKFDFSKTGYTPQYPFRTDELKRVPPTADEVLIDLVRIDLDNPSDVSAALSHPAVAEKKAPENIYADPYHRSYDPLSDFNKGSWPKVVESEHMAGTYSGNSSPIAHISLRCDSIPGAEDPLEAFKVIPAFKEWREKSVPAYGCAHIASAVRLPLAGDGHCRTSSGRSSVVHTW